jgi:trk system potassium uptake protein TrkA
MYVMIVGCGALGSRSAYSQLHAGHEVLLLDTDESRVATVQKSLGNIAMLGDATEEFTLYNAGIDRCDAFIATTGDDAVNLASCQLAKFTFGVETVVSIVNHSSDTNLFLTAGVDKVVSRTDVILANLAGTLLDHPMAELMRLNDRNEKLVSMKIPSNAQSVGNRFRDLALPYGIIIALIVSSVGSPFVPNEDTVILGGEEVIASCPAEALDELAYVLTGQRFSSLVA